MRFGSAAKPVDDDTEFATDLDAEQYRYDGNSARAEESTELAEWKHPTVQKSAREHQPRNTGQNEQHARQRFSDSEKIMIEPDIQAAPAEAA